MKRALFITVFFVFLCATLFAIDQKITFEKKSYADTALNSGNTDTCGRVRFQNTENPTCNTLVKETVGVSCTIPNGSKKNNITSYSVDVGITSNDGRPHTITYTTLTNFCNNGYLGFDGTYCTCTDQGQQTTKTISVPTTVTMSRSSPTGQACGSYQLDFYVDAVDGDSSCHYGTHSGTFVPGINGLCDTGTTCGTITTYTISGNVYNDANKNGMKNTGESNYSGGINISANQGTITTSPNGDYTISNITAGAVTVSYSVLPAGYNLTYPLNGPPPSFQITVGPGCTTNGANDANCSGGNITNLNFGITNLKPWFQAACGSIRNDNGLTNPVPASLQALVTASSCNSPGIAFSGDGSASFTPGQASTTTWIVGGLSYPEIYDIQAPDKPLSLSYTNLLAKQQHAQLAATDLANICSLSSCTLPANLPHGIYKANGNVTLNSFTFPANQHYIFLINGNLTITGPITLTQGSGATALFSTAGNIVVNPTVGAIPSATQTQIDGIYSTDRSFVVASAGGCTDLRLNIGGNVITNAGRTGGSFQNNRDLCANDATYPAVSFMQRLDLLLNTPTFLQEQTTLTTEVSP